MNKLLLRFLILLCISLLATYDCARTELVAHKEFHSLSPMGDNSFQLCFKGIPPQTTFMILEDTTISNLKTIIDEDSVKLWHMDTKMEVEIEDMENSEEVLENESGSQISIDLHHYVFDETTHYCISFSCHEDNEDSSTDHWALEALSNLKIIAASSWDTNRIAYSEASNFSTFRFYHLVDSAVEVGNPTPDVNEIMLEEKFNVKVPITVSLPGNKRIIHNNTFIRIKLMGAATSVSTYIRTTAFSSTINNQLDKELKDFQAVRDLKDDSIIDLWFEEDLIDGRRFNVEIYDLTIHEDCDRDSEDYTITFDVLWKNTNSVISSSSSKIGIMCKKRTISDGKVRHISDYPVLFVPGSYPLEITFKVNDNFANQEIIVSTSVKHIEFLGATCNIPSDSKADCKTVNGVYDKLYIKSASGNKNAEYKIKVWIAARRYNIYGDIEGYKMYDSPTEFISNSLMIKVEIIDFSDSITINSGPKLRDAIQNINVIHSDEDEYPECIPNSDYTNDSGCINYTAHHENSNNFNLIHDDTPSSLNSLKGKSFEIRINYSTNGEGWADELKKAYVPPAPAPLIRNLQAETYYISISGDHRFYFPPNYVTVTNKTNKTVEWKNTNTRCSSSSIDYSKYESEETSADLTTQDSLYKRSATYSLLDANNSNIIKINNSTNKVGMFYNYWLAIKTEDGDEVISDTCESPGRRILEGIDDVFHIKVESVTIKYSTPTSIYDAFDFSHFYYKTGTATYPIRSNRFVSLSPQTGIFSINEIYDSETLATSDNAYLDHLDDEDDLRFISQFNSAICILELQVSQSFSNLETAANSKLIDVLYLFGSVFFLDFENMSKYPTSNGESRAANTNSQMRIVYQSDSSEADLTAFLGGLGADDKTANDFELDWSDDQNTYEKFLLSRVIINYNSAVNTVYLPVSCFSNYDGEFLYTSFSNKSNPENTFEITLENKFEENLSNESDSDQQITFGVDNFLKFGLKSNKLTANAKINTYNDSDEDQTYEFATKPKNRYISVLSNFDVHDIMLMSNDYASTQLFPNESSTSFFPSTSNPLKIKIGSYENVFTYQLFIITNDEFLFVKESNQLNLNIVHNSFHNNVAKNDLMIFADIESDDNSVAVAPGTSTINEATTGYSGGMYMHRIEVATSYTFEPDDEVELSTIITTLDVLTNGIKSHSSESSSEVNQYICAKVVFNVKPLVDTVVIYFDENINEFTIGELDPNEAGAVEIDNDSVTVSNLLNSTKKTLILCNLDLSYYSESDDVQGINLEITSVVMMAGGRTLYDTYGDNIADTTVNISQNLYTHNYINTAYYDNWQTTYSTLTLSASLDHEVYRHMKLTIVSDAIKNLTVINGEVNCMPTFGISQSNPGIDKIFKSCEVNFDNGIITVTTHNRILETNYPKVVEIKLWPVIAYDVSSLNFEVFTTFVGEEDSLFITKQVKPTLISKLDTSKEMEPCSIVPKVIDILPSIPGLIGEIIVRIDSDEISKCAALTESSINEIVLYFSPSVYGLVNKDTLSCYAGLSTSEDTMLQETTHYTNCFEHNNFIHLRGGELLANNSDATDFYVIKIYGFKVLDVYDSSIRFDFLIQFNSINTETETITTLVHGQGSITTGNTNIANNGFDEASDDYNNLAVLEQSFSNTEPNTLTTLTLKLAVDDLEGLKSDLFVIPTVEGAKVYVELPYNLRLTAESRLTITQVVLNLDVLDEDTEEGDYSEFIEIPLDLDDEKTYMTGNLISAELASLDLQENENNSLPWDNDTQYLLVTISDIQTPWYDQYNDDTRSSLTNFVFVQGEYVFRTEPFLYTYEDSDENNIEHQYDYITHHRGYRFQFGNTKYYSEIGNFKPVPGAYSDLEIEIKTVGTPVDASIDTYVKLTVNTDTIFSTHPNSDYTFNGFIQPEITMQIGVACQALPGLYWLMISNSDNSSFYESIQPIAVFLDLSIPKTRIRLFDFDYDEITSPFVISSFIGGETKFMLYPSALSISKITVNFSAKDGNGISIPSSVIEENSMDYVFNSFRHNSDSLDKFGFELSLVGNECFTVVSSIEFRPNIEIEAIDEEIDLLPGFTFATASKASSSQGIMDNEIRITYNTKIVVIPKGYKMCCSLYCADRGSPSEEKLSSPETPEDTWYEGYYCTGLEPNSIYTNVFKGLARDVEYNLMCHVWSAHLDSEEMLSASVTIEDFEDKPIMATPLEIYPVVIIDVKALDEDFKTEVHKILQNAFYQDFESNGCVVVLDEESSTMESVGWEELVCNIRDDDSSGEDGDEEEEEEEEEDKEEEEEEEEEEVRILQEDEEIVDDPVVIDEPKEEQLFYKFALSSLRTCITTSKSIVVNKIIQDLFKDAEKNSGLVGSAFERKLSKSFQANFMGYRLVELNQEFEVDVKMISAKDMSDLQITNGVVQMQLEFTSTYEDPMYCYFILSETAKGAKENDAPTIDDIVNCSSTHSQTQICFDGTFIGTIPYNAELDKSALVNGKTYWIWMTCKEIYVTAQVMSTPNAILKVEATLIDEVIPDETCKDCFVACDSKNPEFPMCCESKSVHEDDPSICSACYLNGFALLLMLLALIFFN